MNEIIRAIDALSTSQRRRLEKILTTMSRPVPSWRNPDSDFVTEEFLKEFGERIQSHHLDSLRALSKENFEYLTVATFKSCGVKASKTVSGTFSGADVIVNQVPWSLKSEAAANVSPDRIHISKFMELGKGAWETEEDLKCLRDRMFDHLSRYERILIIRCLSKTLNDDSTRTYSYELVEIPKSLFEKARDLPIEFMVRSRQKPVPAYCYVPEDPKLPVGKGRKSDNLLMRLYFDGGSERKLQIQKISKAHCTVHATWQVTTDA